MTVQTHEFNVSSRGDTDIIDITHHVEAAIKNGAVRNGLATVFVNGSTAGITTVEYEGGLVDDLRELFDHIAPQEAHYAHNERWGDGNGHSHVRASLLKSGESFPFKEKKLLLGTWQQIILIDFDNRARKRHIYVQVIGE